jgi:hypothetical protein
MPAGDAVGSFMGGLLQGKAAGRESKQKAEYLEAQKAHVKAQSKALESQLNMEAMKDAILQGMTSEQRMAVLFPKADDTLEAKLAAVAKFLGGGQASSQQAPLPEYDPGSGTPPFRPGATMSVPQQIAQGQNPFAPLGLTQEDLVRGVIKKELGAERPKYSRTAPVIMPDGNPGTAPVREDGLIDLSKAVHAPFKLETQPGVGPGMAPTQTPVNPYSRKPVGAPVQTGPPPTMQVETPTGGGGKVRGVVPLFPGGNGSKVTGTGSGGIRTELDLLDVPIPASDVTKWSDGKGTNPPVGWTPRQAQARGFKQTQEGMPAETGGKVVMLGQAIEDMDKAISMILPPTGGFNRKLAIGAGTNAPEFAVEGSQIVRSAVLNAMSAKLRMETGAQSNESEIQGIVDRYWPSGVRDNEKSARYKMTRLQRFMTDGKFIMDPKGRIVVVEPPAEKKKPDLSLGKKKDPSAMTDAELLKALQ